MGVVDKPQNAVHCPAGAWDMRKDLSKNTNVHPTWEECESRAGVATAGVIFDACLCVICFTGCVWLVWLIVTGVGFFRRRTGWREQAIDYNAQLDKSPGPLSQNPTHQYRTHLTFLILTMAIVFGICCIVIASIQGEERTTFDYRNFRGHSSPVEEKVGEALTRSAARVLPEHYLTDQKHLERPGWPETNTR
eukprot:525849_1